jgi:hypothetical protein
MGEALDDELEEDEDAVGASVIRAESAASISA